MSHLRLENVTKFYGDELIVDGLTLDIPAGQFFALLGPSGCGKTTILRLIAGLEQVDEGAIFLGKKEITHTPIFQRKINTVFQNYALFPHLTVFENIAYSMRVRKKEEDLVYEKVHQMLKVVRLAGHERKQISQISGGQQQRVALARALIAEPDILLLDEPLAALDRRLKEQMLVELMDIQEKLGTTFIYVTHDQMEALTVADRMAILSTHGRIEQLSTPKNVYEFPASRFVANFVGTTNIVDGTLHRTEEHEYSVSTESIGSVNVFVRNEKNWMIPGCHVYMSIRPEKIEITKKRLNTEENHLEGVVKNIIYHGQSTLFDVIINDNRIIKVFKQNEDHFPKEVITYDEEVNLYFDKEDVTLLEN